NPLAFRRALGDLGIEAVEWIDFADHHRYRPSELRRVAHMLVAKGAEAALTTEKDIVNLCEAAGDLLSPLPVYWLRVGMQIEREEEFLREIERRMG
ncbi:MAG TPA: tetraacyldisaccharide 4'-kinase, partial [Candidatus Sulfopaludibacter sp.]|nr:tetraacyldisaccharide 4'-kinase [Candidatus Sulfopaludibacter sp.]